MNKPQETPYRVLVDGRIAFDERRYEELDRMFRAAGIDIASIATEADYQAAFSRAGDYFFDALLAHAREDNASRAILQAFVEGRFHDAKALVARQTFEVIPDGRDAPRRSS